MAAAGDDKNGTGIVIRSAVASVAPHDAEVPQRHGGLVTPAVGMLASHGRRPGARNPHGTDMIAKAARLSLTILGIISGTAVCAANAQADDICRGTISASSLRPTAQPLVVSFDQPLDHLANPDLGEQFMNGVRDSGVTVVSKGSATTTIDLSFVVTSGAPGKTAARHATYKNLSWMRSSKPPGHVQSVLRGADVSVTVYARDAASRSLTWTGAITCVVQSDDVQALAHELGAVVGRSIGRTLPKVAL